MVGLAAIFFGCTAEPEEEPFDYWVDAVLSEEIPTVVTVTWEATEEDVETGRVDVWDEVGRSLVPAPAIREGDQFTAVVVGLKPSSDYGLRAAEDHTGGWLFSESTFVTTGGPPGVLPHLEVTASGVHGGGYIATSTVSFPSMAVILDRDGDCVWWHQLEAPDGGDWETFYIPRAALSRDGGSVLYEAATGVENENRERIIVRVSVDGEEVETLPVQGAHHDFLQLPDGTLAVLMEDERAVGEQLIEGDQIVEVEPAGGQTAVWSIWDHAEFDPDEEYDPNIGWSHANAIQYDEQEDAYYVSVRNFDAVYKIDRATGEVIWIAGGEESDFALDGGETTLFERQHRFRMLDDGILIFDNRVPEEGSRAVQYRLDEDTGTAEVTWEYILDPPVFTLGFGDVERLPEGHTLVDWSAQGQIDEVTPEGETVWQINASVGSGFGYMEWFESFYGG